MGERLGRLRHKPLAGDGHCFLIARGNRGDSRLDGSSRVGHGKLGPEVIPETFGSGAIDGDSRVAGGFTEDVHIPGDGATFVGVDGIGRVGGNAAVDGGCEPVADAVELIPELLSGEGGFAFGLANAAGDFPAIVVADRPERVVGRGDGVAEPGGVVGVIEDDGRPGGRRVGQNIETPQFIKRLARGESGRHPAFVGERVGEGRVGVVGGGCAVRTLGDGFHPGERVISPPAFGKHGASPRNGKGVLAQQLIVAGRHGKPIKHAACDGFTLELTRRRVLRDACPCGIGDLARAVALIVEDAHIRRAVGVVDRVKAPGIVIAVVGDEIACPGAGINTAGQGVRPFHSLLVGIGLRCEQSGDRIVGPCGGAGGGGHGANAALGVIREAHRIRGGPANDFNLAGRQEAPGHGAIPRQHLVRPMPEVVVLVSHRLTPLGDGLDKVRVVIGDDGFRVRPAINDLPKPPPVIVFVGGGPGGLLACGMDLACEAAVGEHALKGRFVRQRDGFRAGGAGHAGGRAGFQAEPGQGGRTRRKRLVDLRGGDQSGFGGFGGGATEHRADNLFGDGCCGVARAELAVAIEVDSGGFKLSTVVVNKARDHPVGIGLGFELPEGVVSEGDGSPPRSFNAVGAPGHVGVGFDPLAGGVVFAKEGFLRDAQPAFLFVAIGARMRCGSAHGKKAAVGRRGRDPCRFSGQCFGAGDPSPGGGHFGHLGRSKQTVGGCLPPGQVVVRPADGDRNIVAARADHTPQATQRIILVGRGDPRRDLRPHIAEVVGFKKPGHPVAVRGLLQPATSEELGLAGPIKIFDEAGAAEVIRIGGRRRGNDGVAGDVRRRARHQVPTRVLIHHGACPVDHFARGRFPHFGRGPQPVAGKDRHGGLRHRAIRMRHRAAVGGEHFGRDQAVGRPYRRSGHGAHFHTLGGDGVGRCHDHVPPGHFLPTEDFPLGAALAVVGRVQNPALGLCRRGGRIQIAAHQLGHPAFRVVGKPLPEPVGLAAEAQALIPRQRVVCLVLPCLLKRQPVRILNPARQPLPPPVGRVNLILLRNQTVGGIADFTRHRPGRSGGRFRERHLPRPGIRHQGPCPGGGNVRVGGGVRLPAGNFLHHKTVGSRGGTGGQRERLELVRSRIKPSGLRPFPMIQGDFDLLQDAPAIPRLLDVSQPLGGCHLTSWIAGLADGFNGRGQAAGEFNRRVAKSCEAVGFESERQRHPQRIRPPKLNLQIQTVHLRNQFRRAGKARHTISHRRLVAPSSHNHRSQIYRSRTARERRRRMARGHKDPSHICLNKRTTRRTSADNRLKCDRLCGKSPKRSADFKLLPAYPKLHLGIAARTLIQNCE